MRVNLGCGQAYMEGWLNVDGSPAVRADVHMDAVDFIRRHGHECTEVYMGHFLEHVLPGHAHSLLRLAASRLPAGSRVSAVCPDIRAVFEAYRMGTLDNRTLNESFIYSYVQPSHHVWCHDTDSLTQLFIEAGLADVTPIDPLTWPPVYWKAGPESLYQCGVVGTVLRHHDQAAEGGLERPSLDVALPPADDDGTSAAAAQEPPLSPDEELLERVARYRERVNRLEARLREAELGRQLASHHASTLQRSLDALHGSRTITLATRAAALAMPSGTRRREIAMKAARHVPLRRRPSDET